MLFFCRVDSFFSCLFEIRFVTILIESWAVLSIHFCVNHKRFIRRNSIRWTTISLNLCLWWRKEVVGRSYSYISDDSGYFQDIYKSELLHLSLSEMHIAEKKRFDQSRAYFVSIFHFLFHTIESESRVLCLLIPEKFFEKIFSVHRKVNKN